MTRRIEVLDGNTWREVETWAEAEAKAAFEWRYVGGVLEFLTGPGSGNQWLGLSGQQDRTIDEARAEYPGREFRLRPYDDASPKPQGITSQLTKALQQDAALQQSQYRAGMSAGIQVGLLQHDTEANARANRLSDECGALRTELDEAYAKIGRLTREVERLGRKQ